jgi:hypothetical protein
MNVRMMAMRHIGRPVVIHSTYGVHYGVLHHVDDNGIYLHRTQTGQMVSGSSNPDVVCLDQLSQESNAEQVFFPFFFLPWLALGAVGPWGYWW